MRYLLIVAAFAACSSASTSEQLCDRAQSCNLLAAGHSADECVQDVDNAINQLPANQRDEVEYDLQQCLDHPSCSGFGDCLDQYLGGT